MSVLEFIDVFIEVWEALLHHRKVVFVRIVGTKDEKRGIWFRFDVGVEKFVNQTLPVFT